MVTVVFKCESEIWGGPSPKKFGGPKTSKFRILRFDREYLRTGTRYRRSENGVENYNHSPTRLLHLVNFGPQTAKNRTCISTHSIDFFGRSYLSSRSTLPAGHAVVTWLITSRRNGCADREKFDPYSVAAIPIYWQKRIPYLAHYRVHKKLTRWKRRRRTPRWGKCLR